MTATPQIRANIAPQGRLRVALNHGNRVLVSRDAAGRAQGIAVDIAHAVAQALDLRLDFVEFERAVDVSSSAQDDVWDVCFLAVDPKRAETIAFTDPYVRIEGSYLAGPDCPASDSAALIAAGLPVGTVVGTAYALTLTRLPGHEALVPCHDIHAMLLALDRQEIAAASGIRQVMEAEAALRPGSRVLEPPFMEIRQAMAVPAGRPDAAAWLRHFVSDAARSGRIADILEAHGVDRSCALLPQ
ncbi:transporter substrate-binding domain-containing protein [Cereibacter sphaeroides]|nr:transporter substrate-binding domain-containing protein [Cereibacter sphaeroides]